MSKYMGPIKWLGGAALIVFVIGLIFGAISQSFPPETRDAVLVRAIPFVAVFVSILLLFILFIFIVALRFNGRIPGRTYRAMEYTIILGILVGVVCLFQPWNLVPYRYGFILLLGSTLVFIVWSHVLPGSAVLDAEAPPLTVVQHAAGVVVGIIVLIVLATSAISVNTPVEPYGVRQRVWDSYTEERKADLAAQAVGNFQSVEVPFLIVFNLFPAAMLYFVTREVVGRAGRRTLSREAVQEAGGQGAAAQTGH